MESSPCDRSVSTEELALRCYRESKKYLSGTDYDDVCCLELFRRALLEEQDAAWRAIYVQFFNLLQRWVRGHPRFRSTEEDAAFLINIALSRFWQSMMNRQEFATVDLDSIAGILQYLKSCVYSAVEDTWRWQDRQPPRSEFSMEDLADVLVDDSAVPQPQMLFSPEKILHQAVMERLKTPAEEIVARLSWQYGLPPRQIQDRHPELFPTVQRVYDIKKNLLDRLLLDPYIQNLRKPTP